jgi:hypothetical protein
MSDNIQLVRKLYDSFNRRNITVRDGRIVKFQEFFDTFAAAEAFRSR